MSLSLVQSRALIGLHAAAVTVEVPAIVGLTGGGLTGGGLTGGGSSIERSTIKGLTVEGALSAVAFF